MNRRTRYFLVASGLVLVVGLGTGLVAVYSSGFPFSRAAAPSDLAYIPSGVAAVAFADVRHIMDSEFRQRLRAALPTGEGKDRLLAETGIDVERDIDAVTAGLSASSASGQSPLVLLRGRFDANRVESAGVRHGGTLAEYKGRRLLRVPERSDGGGAEPDHGPPAIAFLEPGLVALGSEAALKASIDAAERGDTVMGNRDLMGFVNEISASSDAWIAGRVDAMNNHPGLSGTMRSHLDAVQWFAVSAGIDQAVTCRVRAEARDAESAQQLRDVVNGALAMARMMAGKDERFAGLLDSIQSTGTGTRMEVSFTVPPEVLEAVTSQHQPQLQAN